MTQHDPLDGLWEPIHRVSEGDSVWGFSEFAEEYNAKDRAGELSETDKRIVNQDIVDATTASLWTDTGADWETLATLIELYRDTEVRPHLTAITTRLAVRAEFEHKPQSRISEMIPKLLIADHPAPSQPLISPNAYSTTYFSWVARWSKDGLLGEILGKAQSNRHWALQNVTTLTVVDFEKGLRLIDTLAGRSDQPARVLGTVATIHESSFPGETTVICNWDWSHHYSYSFHWSEEKVSLLSDVIEERLGETPPNSIDGLRDFLIDKQTTD